VRIKVSGKKEYFGTYANEVEAAIAANKIFKELGYDPSTFNII
jgi:hypothetical protein